jgi:hypothetical protein
VKNANNCSSFPKAHNHKKQHNMKAIPESAPTNVTPANIANCAKLRTDYAKAHLLQQ